MTRTVPQRAHTELLTCMPGGQQARPLDAEDLRVSPEMTPSGTGLDLPLSGKDGDTPDRPSAVHVASGAVGASGSAQSQPERATRSTQTMSLTETQPWTRRHTSMALSRHQARPSLCRRL